MDNQPPKRVPRPMFDLGGGKKPKPKVAKVSEEQVITTKPLRQRMPPDVIKWEES